MKRITVLTGGVGGAKVVLGLATACPDDEIIAIVNTGDDFRHMGLHVSPDIDTLLYTLSGQSNEAQGWGRKDETWTFMSALRSLGAEDWFNLGDGDLALHVVRSWRMDAGETLSAITADFARQWGISTRILPMSDDPVSTIVQTEDGEMPFQNYFVEKQCRPAIEGFRFKGAETARPAAGVIEAMMQADAVIIAPSNPYLSIDPILAVPGVVNALASTAAPVVAVSPIVGGKAVKGPTAKIMQELGIPSDNLSIARHYDPFLDGLVIDQQDAPPGGSVAVRTTKTLMKTLEDRQRVATEALDLADHLACQ